MTLKKLKRAAVHALREQMIAAMADFYPPTLGEMVEALQAGAVPDEGAYTWRF